MKLAIVGTGYVGLVTGACFAQLGHDVRCVDKDEEKLELMRSARAPFHEPGLDGLLKNGINNGRISFTNDMAEAIPQAEVVFIVVGTYPLPDGSPDLAQVFKATEEIAQHLKGYTVIAEKSTVPPGTGTALERIIEETNPGSKFDVVSNPEFLREGTAIRDTVEPDRVIVGTDNRKALEIMHELYRPVLEASHATRYMETDRCSAEMIKYSANAFLATKISFINSISRICDLSGADVGEVANGIGLDHRIGPAFLRAGIGYGGSCLPKDVSAFINFSSKLGYDYRLLKEVQAINTVQREYFVNKVKSMLGGVKGKKLAVLGLSFKPGTDDLREAPSLQIISTLLKDGADIVAYDPVTKVPESISGRVRQVSKADKAADGADALLFVAEWPELANLDFAQIKNRMRRPIIFDGRNFLSAEKLGKLGFEYIGLGRRGFEYGARRKCA